LAALSNLRQILLIIRRLKPILKQGDAQQHKAPAIALVDSLWSGIYTAGYAFSHRPIAVVSDVAVYLDAGCLQISVDLNFS
jgi:hypothetical protein